MNTLTPSDAIPVLEWEPMDRHTTTTLVPGRPAMWTVVVLVIVIVVLMVLW
jgi:hypothetical protein